MDFDDFGKPLITGRSGRILLGAIFLAFAAILGFAGVVAYANNLLVASVCIAIAIGLGYIGIRLVTIADGEQLFGRVASFVAAVIMIVSGVALAGLCIGRGDIDKLLSLGPGIIFGIAGGGWLLRSTIRRKDEP